jgi:hypothetical protein
MTTNRTPIERPTLTTISSRVLEIFAELERARRARLHADDCEVRESGMCKGECAACERWWSAHNALHVELHLPPWIWPCIPFCPIPPSAPAAREWRPCAEEKELYVALVAARRARATRRTAPSPQEDIRDVDREPIH